MDDLEKYIIGQWFDIKKKADRLPSLREHFSLPPDILGKTLEKLQLAVEGGIIEYKKRAVMPVFNFFESMRYDSRKYDDLDIHMGYILPVIFITLIQRLICKGILEIKGTDQSFAPPQPVSLKELLNEIKVLVKTDPALGQHHAIKNIHMHANRYKRELDQMKKLAPNIPKEKAPSFYTNFKKVFDQLTASMYDNYKTLIKEVAQKHTASNPNKGWGSLNLTPLAPFFLNQAKDITRIYSTLDFAKKEKYKTRDILNHMTQKRDYYLSGFTQEARVYYTLLPQEHRVSKAFAQEIIPILKKEIHKA